MKKRNNAAGRSKERSKLRKCVVMALKILLGLWACMVLVYFLMMIRYLTYWRHHSLFVLDDIGLEMNVTRVDPDNSVFVFNAIGSERRDTIAFKKSNVYGDNFPTEDFSGEISVTRKIKPDSLDSTHYSVYYSWSYGMSNVTVCDRTHRESLYSKEIVYFYSCEWRYWMALKDVLPQPVSSFLERKWEEFKDELMYGRRRRLQERWNIPE